MSIFKCGNEGSLREAAVAVCEVAHTKKLILEDLSLAVLAVAGLCPWVGFGCLRIHIRLLLLDARSSGSNRQLSLASQIDELRGLLAAPKRNRD